MQLEPYDQKDGYRCWLSRSEQDAIREFYEEEPQKQVAVDLMLDGLRSEEALRVARRDFRQLAGEETYKLRVREGKTGWRETPVGERTRSQAVMLASARGLRQDDPVLDVSTRTVQRWVTNAAQDVAEEAKGDDWEHVTAHDLRRTWATDVFYTLAFAGVPIAEELVMGWGGWTMNESGRKTFRENYLGPEPDHIAHQAMQQAGLA